MTCYLFYYWGREWEKARERLWRGWAGNSSEKNLAASFLTNINIHANGRSGCLGNRVLVDSSTDSFCSPLEAWQTRGVLTCTAPIITRIYPFRMALFWLETALKKQSPTRMSSWCCTKTKFTTFRSVIRRKVKCTCWELDSEGKR